MTNLRILYLFFTPCVVTSFIPRTQPAPSRPSSLVPLLSIPDEQRLWKGDLPEVQVVSAMPPNLAKDDLKHKYYLLRHGQSTANVDEVISSDRTTLAYTDKHGLTAMGYEQGRESATQLLDMLGSSSSSSSSPSPPSLQNSSLAQKGDSVVFVSSPFARARETAQACLDGLLQDLRPVWQEEMGLKVVPDIYYHDLLMERAFGRLDNEAIYTYAYVWPLDRMNVTHTAFDVESVAAVCTRLHQLVHDIENQLDLGSSGEEATTTTATTHVVLVSHADVLQIAQLYAAQVPNVGEFSSYRFKNGEVRRMEIGSGFEGLPEASPLPPPQRGTGM